jgi:hypothetical protein
MHYSSLNPYLRQFKDSIFELKYDVLAYPPLRRPAKLAVRVFVSEKTMVELQYGAPCNQSKPCFTCP